jgi:protein-S-isoprenylcysteine O-methyltransferase Ste14
MKAEKWGQWLFQRRGRFQIPFVLAALALLRPHYPFGSHWLDELTDITGFLFMLGGVALRVWVIGYRKSGTSGRSREMETSQLVTDGAYACIRNPLYLANIIIVFGAMIIFLNPWLFLVFAAYCLHYYLIIMAEEEYLTRRFGVEYLRYKQRVPRLIPAIGRNKWTAPARKFDWNQVMRKEKDVFLGVILGPIVLEIYEDILHEGWRRFLGEDSGELVVYLLVAVLTLFLWLFVIHQKKRRTI